MLWITRTLHVLAVGLWFGTAVFFTFVVGLSLFDTFATLTAKPANDPERPVWLPVPPGYDHPRPTDHFPEPLRKEQGSRIAGAAVGPMFPPYYLIQTVCGVLALATALIWWRMPLPQPRLNFVRVLVLVVALAGAGVGWWMDGVIHELGKERVKRSDEAIVAVSPSPEVVRVAEEARANFGRWHTYSILVDLFTLALVTGAMAMAGHLPTHAEAPDSAAPTTWDRLKRGVRIGGASGGQKS
jgi:hypothetical protein